MKNIAYVVLLAIGWLLSGCESEAGPNPDIAIDIDVSEQWPRPSSSIAAPLGYPAPGYHRLDTYCLSDQTLNRSIYFEIDINGQIESDVLTAGRAFRLLNAAGQPVWRLFVQQADRDAQGCVTLFEYTVLVDVAGTGHVAPGTFRRECFTDEPTATVIECLGLYY